jgi:hypothetical protein
MVTIWAEHVKSSVPRHSRHAEEPRQPKVGVVDDKAEARILDPLMESDAATRYTSTGHLAAGSASAGQLLPCHPLLPPI